jgi:hypothetical protein
MRGSKKDLKVAMKEKGFEIREAVWGDTRGVWHLQGGL